MSMQQRSLQDRINQADTDRFARLRQRITAAAPSDYTPRWRGVLWSGETLRWTPAEQGGQVFMGPTGWDHHCPGGKVPPWLRPIERDNRLVVWF